jgi:hypothetical protein
MFLLSLSFKIFPMNSICNLFNCSTFFTCISMFFHGIISQMDNTSLLCEFPLILGSFGPFSVIYPSLPNTFEPLPLHFLMGIFSSLSPLLTCIHATFQTNVSAFSYRVIFHPFHLRKTCCWIIKRRGE